MIMLSRAKPKLLVFTLALAFFTVWAAYSILETSSDHLPTWKLAEHIQQEVGVDHFHTSHIGDHHHDVPHLISGLSFNGQADTSLRPDVEQSALPPSPIFLIKRPPRVWLLT